MSDLSRISDTDIHSVDSDARKEKDTYYPNKAKRDNREANVLHWAFVVFTWIAFGLVILLVITKVVHTILPEDSYFRWLRTKEEMSRLDEFFTDGSVGGLLVGFFKSNILKKKASAEPEE